MDTGGNKWHRALGCRDNFDEGGLALHMNLTSKRVPCITFGYVSERSPGLVFKHFPTNRCDDVFCEHARIVFKTGTTATALVREGPRRATGLVILITKVPCARTTVHHPTELSLLLCSILPAMTPNAAVVMLRQLPSTGRAAVWRTGSTAKYREQDPGDGHGI